MKKAKFQQFIQNSALALIAFITIMVLSNCSYEPEITNSAIQFTFSTDTIQFDTVFTERKTITKRLKVFNPSEEAALIENISLSNEAQSFELLINGAYGDSFDDVLVLPKDSLLVLIEANIDQNDVNNPFVIRDQLSFYNKEIQQNIVIEAWGQNAHYLNDSILSCNTTWTAEKPYVLSNSILVDEGCSLTIEAGTKVYSGKDSFILVAGQLIAEGLVDSTIIFTNDRLEEPYSSTPGQWGGIVILEGSTDNQFSHCEITNAIFGFNINSFSANNSIDLKLNSVKVGNLSTNAILSVNSDFEAVNCLFYNTVSSTSIHIGGGIANYEYCTIANYFPVSRENPAVYISDYALDNEDIEYIASVNSTFINSIVYGRINEEIVLTEYQENNIMFDFSNCLFKSSNTGFSANNSFLNQDPLFIDAVDDNFMLKEGSPAISQALPTSINKDIIGTDRGLNPDIGAYEYVPEME